MLGIEIHVGMPAVNGGEGGMGHVLKVTRSGLWPRSRERGSVLRLVPRVKLTALFPQLITDRAADHSATHGTRCAVIGGFVADYTACRRAAQRAAGRKRG